VSEGSVAIDLAGERYMLGAGDSIVFEAGSPHAYVNVGESTRGCSS